VEAPDECGHRGEVQNKVKAIEAIDQQILGPLLERLEDMKPYSLLILPDHPTPLEIRTHSAEPVPYLMYAAIRKRMAVRHSPNRRRGIPAVLWRSALP